jgi:MFS family permease
VLLLYQAVSSLTQPFFGRLSERVGGRSMGVAAILWTTLMFSGVLFAPSKVLLAVSSGWPGWGRGPGHPKAQWPPRWRVARAGGQPLPLSFFWGARWGSAVLGSALGGWLLGAFGRPSLLVISAITASVALFVVRAMVPRQATPTLKTAEAAPTASNGNGKRAFWTILVLLLASTAFRSLVAHSLNTYIPKYQQDLGVSPEVYGAIMSLFLVATAVGGVSGSYLADRIGIRNVLVGTMVLGGILLLPFVHATGFWSYASLILSGFMIGPSHTLLVIAGQRQFPQRMAMASGIFLGFNFVSGAGGA